MTPTPLLCRCFKFLNRAIVACVLLPSHQSIPDVPWARLFNPPYWPGAAAFGLKAAGFDLFPAKLPVALFLPRLCAAPPVSPETVSCLQTSAPDAILAPGPVSDWELSQCAFRSGS